MEGGARSFRKSYFAKLLALAISILLLVILGIQYKEDLSLSRVLTSEEIPAATYIVDHSKEAWDTDSESGYYLFVENEMPRIEVRDFRQNLILSESYSFIGNGVFQLSGRKGFVLKSRQGVRLLLSEKNENIPYTDFLRWSR